MQTRNHLGGTNGTFQELTEVGGFQDLSCVCRCVTVLRHTVAGLTLYANVGNSGANGQWRNRHAYVLAYESEETPNDQVEQVILETDDPRTIWRLLELVNQHTERVQREMTLLMEARGVGEKDPHGANAANPLKLMKIAGFKDTDTRAAIETTLAGLTDTSVEHAYAGFVNAVCSNVDAWLTSRSL